MLERGLALGQEGGHAFLLIHGAEQRMEQAPLKPHALTKWCFKRVFNARTGELLYLRDDAALFDKKLGFLSEDLRMIEQSR